MNVILFCRFIDQFKLNTLLTDNFTFCIILSANILVTEYGKESKTIEF